MQLSLLPTAAPTTPLTDSDQRYTPQWVINMAIATLGPLDLDPTANPAKTVPAKAHITEAMDTFTTPWDFAGHPRSVWLNPPYSKTGLFIERMIGELTRLDFAAVSLTLPGLLHNKGAQPMIKKAIANGHLRAACFWNGRINFDYPVAQDGRRSNDRDSLFLLWGNGDGLVEKFEGTFKKGLVVRL